MAFPQHMDPVEKTIIEAIIRRALAKGYLISVFDGEEFAITFSPDYEKITAEIAATDETTLEIEGPDKRIGSIWLIHGNGEDVVSDCTDTPLIHELVAG